MNSKRICFLSLAIALLCVDTEVLGQTQRSGSDSARVMQQLQQATAERTKLQADNDGLKKELEELKEKYAKTTAAQSSLQQKAREAELASTRQQTTGKDTSEALEKSKAQLQELIGKFRETAQSLKTTETDNTNLKTQLETQERTYKTCVDRNAGMYFLNDEILRRMEDRGFWSKLSEHEPFTKIARTRLENLIDDYRYRVEELRVTKQNSASANAR